MVGKVVAHYQILEKLGEGGMGMVYKARDSHLDRFVAIKVLSPERLANAAHKARFIQEAKAASALNHPNIIVVHDVAADGDTEFIVMEYVSGRTLDQIIRERGMPPREVLNVAIQMADALECAHAAGIVHRDLKPSNVMVDGHGLVKVLDFGLAKLAGARSSDEASTLTIRPRTEDGAIVGTAAYMSPEQAEGKSLDERSDIFSFGEVLYEMISGQRAFRGDTSMAILASIIKSPPEPLAAGSRDLEAIVHRCLRKDPSARYQHMKELKADLEQLREQWHSGEPVGAWRRPWRRQWLWAVGAAAVVGAAAGLWMYGRAIRESLLPPPSVVPLTTYRGHETFPSFSPDGAQVAFVWSGERQENPGIYIKPAAADKPVRLTSDPRPDVSPAWSPDGRYIAFLRQLEPQRVGCYVVPATGGAERKVGELGGQISQVFRGLAWMPDNARLVVGVMASASWHSSGLAGLSVVSLASGTQEEWTRPPGIRGQDVSPSVSPDGRRIAFARVLDFDQSELFVMDVPAAGARPGTARRVGVNRPGAAEPVWTQDGRELIFTAGFSGQPSLWRVEPGRPEAARQIQITGINVLQPALSGKGRRLAYATSFLARPDIWRVMLRAPGVAAGAPEVLIGSSQMDQNPSYSPDGGLIAFESSRSGAAEIWITDKDGQNPMQITSLGTRPNSPVWSPDGRQLAFRCQVDGLDEVCVASTLGGAARRLTENPAQDRAESWSPDGTWILFNSTRGGRPQTWRVPATGGESEFVEEGSRGRLSADGKTRFRVDADNWVTSEPSWGGRAERLAGPLSMAGNWAPTGDGIYFIPRAPDGRYAVMYYDLRTRAVREAARLSGAPGWGMAASRDGKAVLFTMSENAASGSDLMMVENFR